MRIKINVLNVAEGLKISDTTFEEVTSFTYLGSPVNSDNIY